jgi:hypothetical protein
MHAVCTYSPSIRAKAQDLEGINVSEFIPAKSHTCRSYNVTHAGRALSVPRLKPDGLAWSEGGKSRA